MTFNANFKHPKSLLLYHNQHHIWCQMSTFCQHAHHHSSYTQSSVHQYHCLHLTVLF